MNPTDAILTLYRCDFPSFARFAFQELETGPLFENWYVELLLGLLERWHRGEFPRLIVNAPPRSLKSFMASVVLPAFSLGSNPRLNILVICGDSETSAQLARLLRRLLTGARYRHVFPHIELRPGRDIVLATGGRITFAKYQTSLGGPAPDLVLIDDPIAPIVVADRKERERANAWYTAEVTPRLRQSSLVLLIMRRLHRDDLTAHLLSSGFGPRFAFAAVADKDENWWLPRGRSYQRPRREPLRPEFESAEALCARLDEIGACNFMAQYQQDPYNEEAPKNVNVREVHDPIPLDWTPEMGLPHFGWYRINETEVVCECLFGEDKEPTPSRHAITDEEWQQSLRIQQDRLLESMKDIV